MNYEKNTSSNFRTEVLRQTIIASVVLAIYFPCVATFVVILKELGILGTLKATAIMAASVLIVGGVLNLALTLVGY